MEKFKELKPLQKKYFENLFKNSKIFTEEIESFRKKYNLNITKKVDSLYSENVNFYRADKEMINKLYSQKEKEKWQIFDDDLKKLATYFFLDNYYIYFKKYILGRPFEPLSFQKIIKLTPEKIIIEIPYQITKTDFNKIWVDIKSSQKSHFSKKILNNNKIEIRNKKGNFDNKFQFYRNKKYNEKLSDNIKKLDNEKSNILKRISEIEKQIKSL